MTAKSANSVDYATYKDRSVWWLWPNSRLMRYQLRGDYIVMRIIPEGVKRTLRTRDFLFESSEPNGTESEAIRYIGVVLQAEDT
ncbi:MAG: hypothetical protein OXI87_18290 [Albidovulum sp.]|nr:hypothetical protein [Albidovulum sp.]MDE0530678.1 hypothetical protein [Albidovulum sp.]